MSESTKLKSKDCLKVFRSADIDGPVSVHPFILHIKSQIVERIQKMYTKNQLSNIFFQVSEQ